MQITKNFHAVLESRKKALLNDEKGNKRNGSDDDESDNDRDNDSDSSVW